MSNQPTQAKLLLSPDEYYEELGGAIGRGAIYELIRSGRVRSIRVGRKLLIPRTEVHDFIRRETAEEQPAP